MKLNTIITLLKFYYHWYWDLLPLGLLNVRRLLQPYAVSVRMNGFSMHRNLDINNNITFFFSWILKYFPNFWFQYLNVTTNWKLRHWRNWYIFYKRFLSDSMKLKRAKHQFSIIQMIFSHYQISYLSVYLKINID